MAQAKKTTKSKKTQEKDVPKSEETPVTTQEETETKVPEPEETKTEESGENEVSSDESNEDTSPEEQTQKDETGGESEPASDDEESAKDPQESQEPQETEETKKDDPLAGLKSRIDDYAGVMGPTMPMTSDEIQIQQLRLRSIVTSLLRTKDEQFNEAMKYVVSVVRDNRKGAFSERLVFRGFPQMKLARSERQKLETVISLLLATADTKNPSKVKDVVDMNVVFKYVTDNDQQQKLQSYYGQ